MVPLAHLSASWKSLPGCLASTSDPVCPTHVSFASPGFLWLSLAFPVSRATPPTQLLTRIKGITVPPCPALIAGHLGLGLRPWSTLCSQRCGKGSHLAQLPPLTVSPPRTDCTRLCALVSSTAGHGKAARESSLNKQINECMHECAGPSGDSPGSHPATPPPAVFPGYGFQNPLPPAPS